MGKSKSKSTNNHRHNPNARKPSKTPGDPELAAIRIDKILPVIADLTNPESKRRSSAITAVANLIQDQRCRRLLLREQLVKIVLIQILSDTNLEIQARGWGILQKLLDWEGCDFGVHLYRQDILTPLNYAMGKVGSSRFFRSGLTFNSRYERLQYLAILFSPRFPRTKKRWYWNTLVA